jgi:hypothetical protein
LAKNEVQKCDILLTSSLGVFENPKRLTEITTRINKVGKEWIYKPRVLIELFEPKGSE